MAIQTPEPWEALRTDVNLDGFIDTADALCIFQEALMIPNVCFGALLRTPATDPGGSITISDLTLLQNGDVAVTISVKTTAVLADGQLDLAFNSALLVYEPDGLVRGDLTGNWPLMNANLIKNGQLRIGGLNWSGGIPAGSEGAFCELIFSLRRDVPLSVVWEALQLMAVGGGLQRYEVLE